jgi:hypothetical protein
VAIVRVAIVLSPWQGPVWQGPVWQVPVWQVPVWQGPAWQGPVMPDPSTPFRRATPETACAVRARPSPDEVVVVQHVCDDVFPVDDGAASRPPDFVRVCGRRQFGFQLVADSTIRRTIRKSYIQAGATVRSGRPG